LSSTFTLTSTMSPFIGAPTCPATEGSAFGRETVDTFTFLSRTKTDLQQDAASSHLFQARFQLVETYRSWPLNSKKTSLSPLTVRSVEQASVLNCRVFPCSIVTSNSSAILGPIRK
jgi:hypothetical protein